MSIEKMESFQKNLLSKEGKDKKDKKKKKDKMGKFYLFSPICHCCSPLQNLLLRVRVWVPGFQKSNSGFGFGFRVRKFPKKPGFGLGFVKNIKISAKFP
jgi:hypothetical protein